MTTTRTLTLNGYIDDELCFGDEITPEMLTGQLCGEDGALTDDVAITLNSYGGSCNAATRMYDCIRAYPGNVRITISGTAASAATIVASAADIVEMTPGSLYMVHDPSTLAWGNERELMGAIELLRASKDAILNVYQLRSKLPRDELSRLMTDTTWMDAQSALDNGFIDRITNLETPSGAVAAGARASIVSRAEAEQGVRAYWERRKPRPQPIQVPQAAPTPTPEPQRPGVSYARLAKRLELLKQEVRN